MNPQQFASKIRAKYPGAYDNVSDEELINKVIAKYPVYKSSVVFPTAPKSDSILSPLGQKTVQGVSNIYNEGAQNVKNDITSAAQRYNNAPNTAMGTLVEKPAILLKSVGDVTTDVVKTAFDPVAKPISSLIGFISDKISNIPFVQRIAASDAVGKILKGANDLSQRAEDIKKNHPDLADAVDTLVTIGGIALGEKPIQSAAESTLNTTKKVASDLASGTKNFVDNAVQNSQNKATNKALSDALEITKPVADKKSSIAAFERAGQPGGVTEKGALNKFAIEPSPRDINVAKSVQNIVSSKNGPIDNIVNINQDIGRVSEQEITPFLQKNPSAFNKNQLNSYIKGNVEPADFIKADPVLQKTYDLARQRMIDVVDRYPKTMEGLWKARKEFDAIAEKQVGSLDPMSKEANSIKQAVLDTRRAVNDYIAENTPNGDKMFKEKLKTLSNMYDARGNIAEQNYKLLDKNALQRWIKQNPAKYKLLLKAGGLGFLGVGIGGLKLLSD